MSLSQACSHPTLPSSPWAPSPVSRERHRQPGTPRVSLSLRGELQRGHSRALLSLSPRAQRAISQSRLESPAPH